MRPFYEPQPVQPQSPKYSPIVPSYTYKQKPHQPHLTGSPEQHPRKIQLHGDPSTAKNTGRPWANRDGLNTGFSTLGSKQERQGTDMRTTWNNVGRRMDPGEGIGIRNTTNLTSKLGAVMADARKYEQEEQKLMKKNSLPLAQECTTGPMLATGNTISKVSIQNTNGEGCTINMPSVANIGGNNGSTVNSSSTSNTVNTGNTLGLNTGNVVSKNIGVVQNGGMVTAPVRQGLGEPSFKSLNQLWSKKQSSSQQKQRSINGFQIYKQVGKGKFGQVYLARHINTGFIVALKKVIKSKVMEYKMYEQFKREIRLHAALDHPNIVKFYGVFDNGDDVYLILEYISGGTLFDYLAEKDTLSAREAAEYLKDTIEALNYMHDRSIAHRDIKPENIVLTAERVAKLCDFGWSALVESSRTTYCGTFDYAPPEILQRKNYDTAVDIWCIGVLTYELLTGRVPFEGQKRKQIAQKILSVDKTKMVYPVEITDQARNFIELLVQRDPGLRPKSKDLLKHPFFNVLKTGIPVKDRKP